MRELKNMFELFFIRRRLKDKEPIWIAAGIASAFFTGAMYSFAPAYVCSSYLLSSVFLFFLCCFISMGLHEKEDEVFEEVLLLHSRSDAVYYLSRELLQLGACFVFALILAFAPVLKALSNPHFFTRPVGAWDVICGAAVILFCGVCGIETGDLFHPRLMDRKFGICGLILIALLSVCKEGLIRSLSFFRILNVLLPPVTDSLVLLGDTDRFDGRGIALILLHMILYSVLIALLKTGLMKHRRFGS